MTPNGRIRGRAYRGMLLVPLALLLFAPRPSAAAPPWNPGNRFLIGASDANDFPDADRLLRLHDAGVDFLQEEANRSPADQRALLALLDSLRAARPGFRLQMVAGVNAADPSSRLAGPSLMGWLVANLPCDRAEVKASVAATRAIAADQKRRGLLAWTNLLSNVEVAEPCFEQAYGRDRQAAYESYLEAYLAPFDADPAPAPVLSFAPQPFEDAEFVRDSALLNLKTAVARAGLHSRAAYRIPLWTYLQTSVYPADAPPETLSVAQIRWQAYAAVAYGAKGIVIPKERAADLGALHRELHALGPTLMELDPVAVFHVATGNQMGIGEDLLENYLRPYGIVGSVGGSGKFDCMVGYFKRVGAGDDYLLVMNKNLTKTRSIKITLVSPADSIERVDKMTGERVLVATRTDGFEAKSLPPGGAELFRIADGVFEYIAGVNDVREDGTKVYYVLNRGILRVDYATGARGWVDRTRGKVPPTLRAETLGVVGAPSMAGR